MIDTVKKQIVLKGAGVVVAALCWPLCASASSLQACGSWPGG